MHKLLRFFKQKYISAPPQPSVEQGRYQEIHQLYRSPCSESASTILAWYSPKHTLRNKKAKIFAHHMKPNLFEIIMNMYHTCEILYHDMTP